MKVIIVNHSELSLRPHQLNLMINNICDYFLTKKLRNKSELSAKNELTLAFLGKYEMQKINKTFRNKNKPTDILSFASADRNSLGELLICPEIIKKQAKQQKHTFNDELQYMLIHGILHLLGYDHELSAKEEKLMFRIQEQCFRALGPVQSKK